MRLQQSFCLMGVAGSALLLAAAVRAGDQLKPVLSNDPNLFPSDRVCPVASSRDPLMYYSGKGFQEVREGYRLLLDADSYPRNPARLKGDPLVRKVAGGHEIAFELDGYDDVDVRIVDASCGVVRRLGCGALGTNAPAPFSAGSLKQTLFWDGLDSGGKAAPAGCRVRVSAGLAPRFEGFVGYDRESVVPQIVALDVDHDGRVYVATSVENRGDPVMARFDRDGKYLDMVYPPGPRQLAGRKLEDLYRYAEYVEGRATPTRARSWCQYIYQWPAGTMFPFRIGADGSGYVAEILTGHGSADMDWVTATYRIFKAGDPDHFWFLQNITLLQSFGAFAVDGRGFGYLGCRTFGLGKAANSPDSRAVGTIRKVNLATGEPRADFTWNGTNELLVASEFLGAAPDRSGKGGSANLPRRTAGQPELDSENRFADIADIGIDSKGRILVVDSKPRRIKVYEPNGRFAGILDRLAVDGRVSSFKEISALGVAGEDTYLIASFSEIAPDDGTAPKRSPARGAPVLLVKCAGDILSPSFVWQVEVNAASRYLAVDERANPRVIWIGNGNGPGTFSRVADEGAGPGAAKHFGGTKEGCFRFPKSICADAEGRLYVYDSIAGKIVRIDGRTGARKELSFRTGPIASAILAGPTMFADSVNKRLYVMRSGQAPKCYTLDLDPVKEFALRDADDAGAVRWGSRSGGVIGGVDREGRLYVSDGPLPKKKIRKEDAAPKAEAPAPDGAGPEKTLKKEETKKPRPAAGLAGVIRRYGRDGSVQDEELARLTWGSGSLALDSKGNMYVLDLASAGVWTHVSHNLPCGLSREDSKISGGSGPARLMFRRGNYPVWQQSDLCYLVKFGPEGGERNTETELWSHRGFSPHSGGGCTCDWPCEIVAVDAADRIYAADAIHHHVKVLDTAGNLVARIGWWGNAEDVPSDGDASKVGFWNIYGLAAAGDMLYVSDKDLRRIASFGMKYRETKEVPVK